MWGKGTTKDGLKDWAQATGLVQVTLACGVEVNVSGGCCSLRGIRDLSRVMSDLTRGSRVEERRWFV